MGMGMGGGFGNGKRVMHYDVTKPTLLISLDYIGSTLFFL